jgi:hypothetical protein
VATPNKKQNKTFGSLLSMLICPDLADQKWNFGSIEYLISPDSEGYVDKVVLSLVDKSGKNLLIYIIDENGQNQWRNIHV